MLQYISFTFFVINNTTISENMIELASKNVINIIQYFIVEEEVKMNKNTLLVAGLIVGLIAGFSINYIMSQSQITQLQSTLSETQSTLSDTQSDLSASQSEVQSLQSQLADAQTNVASLETQLAASQDTVTSLEEQLAAKEADYSTLSEEYNEFKSDVSSLIDSLEKKMDLESQIILMWVQYERQQSIEFTTTLFGLGPYVNATGDSELITM